MYTIPSSGRAQCAGRPYLHIYIYIYTYAYIYINLGGVEETDGDNEEVENVPRRAPESAQPDSMQDDMYIYIHTHICIYTYMYIHMYLCKDRNIYI